MIDEKNMTFDDRTQPGDRLIPLQARYSCRSFSDQEIPEELLNQVIAAGLNAPTGGNLQPYTVLVIRNPETKKILAELCGQSFIGGAAVNLLFILDWHRLAVYAQAKHAPFVAEKSFFQNLIALRTLCVPASLWKQQRIFPVWAPAWWGIFSATESAWLSCCICRTEPIRS